MAQWTQRLRREFSKANNVSWKPLPLRPLRVFSLRYSAVTTPEAKQRPFPETSFHTSEAKCGISSRLTRTITERYKEGARGKEENRQFLPQRRGGAEVSQRLQCNFFEDLGFEELRTQRIALRFGYGSSRLLTGFWLKHTHIPSHSLSFSPSLGRHSTRVKRSVESPHG